MLLSYALYMAILVVIVGTSLWFGHRRQQIEKLSEVLQDAEDNVSDSDRLLSAFLNDETINTNFYETGESSYRRAWRKKMDYALSQLKKLDSIKSELGLDAPVPVEALRMNIDSYEKNFEQLVKAVLIRGFKDYGLEGEMRNYIHKIEDVPLTNKALMLMCRRHEKDFFLRKQPQYIQKLKDAADILKIDIIQHTEKGTLRDSLVFYVDKYKSLFEKIVVTEEKIGFDSNSGLRQRVKQSADQLSEQFNQYAKFTEQTVASIKAYSRNMLVIVSGGGFLLGIFLALFIPRLLSRPVRRLSSSIHNVIGSNFSHDLQVAQIKSKDEIGKLSSDFSFMLRRMQALIEETRTHSEKIEKKQQLLLDSIRYAKQIQHAILPSNELIRTFFPNYFLIYRPLHLVSGDFFWMIRKNKKVYVAVADCTGHGVPGAFMSMIGHTLLNKILNQDHIYEPAAILEVLNLEIREALRQQDDEQGITDGMDVSLFSMEYFENKPNERLITFAGAKLPLVYCTQGEIKIVKGTSRSIGGGNTKIQESRNFNSTVFTLTTGDFIYMYSDGFADQNDVQRKKFGKKRLLKSISQHSMISFDLQKNKLEALLDKHQEGTQQRDDITLLALEL